MHKMNRSALERQYTQRALSRGDPVVVVHFGRDQFEVARRVEYAKPGVRLMPNRLNASTLTAAVHMARSMGGGAKRIADRSKSVVVAAFLLEDLQRVRLTADIQIAFVIHCNAFSLGELQR